MAQTEIPHVKIKYRVFPMGINQIICLGIECFSIGHTFYKDDMEVWFERNEDVEAFVAILKPNYAPIKLRKKKKTKPPVEEQ